MGMLTGIRTLPRGELLRLKLLLELRLVLHV